MGERLNKAILPFALAGTLGAGVYTGATVEAGNVAGVPVPEVNFDGVDSASANPGGVGQACLDKRLANGQLGQDGKAETFIQTIRVDQIDGRLAQGRMTHLARIAQNGTVIFNSEGNFKDVASSPKVANPVYEGQKPYSGTITFENEAPAGAFTAETKVTGVDNGQTIGGVKGVITTGPQPFTCYTEEARNVVMPVVPAPVIETTPTTVTVPTPNDAPKCVVAGPIVATRISGKGANRTVRTVVGNDASAEGTISAQGDGLTDPNAARIQTIVKGGRNVLPAVTEESIRVTRSGDGRFVVLTQDVKEDINPGEMVKAVPFNLVVRRGLQQKIAGISTRFIAPEQSITGLPDSNTTGCKTVEVNATQRVIVPARPELDLVVVAAPTL